ncbi:MAG: hypothetical protein ACJ8F7_02130 [Gemmataceae bacterium]
MNWWDVSSGKNVRQLRQNHFTRSVAVSPDGGKIAVGGSDATVRLHRILEVLEESGTEEARSLLKAMAAGEMEWWLPQEAQSSLERIHKRTKSK